MISNGAMQPMHQSSGMHNQGSLYDGTTQNGRMIAVPINSNANNYNGIQQHEHMIGHPAGSFQPHSRISSSRHFLETDPQQQRPPPPEDYAVRQAMSLTSSSSSVGSDLLAQAADPRSYDAAEDRTRQGHSVRSLEPRIDTRASYEHRAFDGRGEADVDYRGPVLRQPQARPAPDPPADSDGLRERERERARTAQAQAAGPIDPAGGTRGPPLIPPAGRVDASGGAGGSAPPNAQALLELSRQLGEANKERDVVRTQVRALAASVPTGVICMPSSADDAENPDSAGTGQHPGPVFGACEARQNQPQSLARDRRVTAARAAMRAVVVVVGGGGGQFEELSNRYQVSHHPPSPCLGTPSAAEKAVSKNSKKR